MLAGICFPLLVVLVFDNKVPALIIFSIVVSVLVVLTHQKNIQRLLKKNDNKTYLFKMKSNLVGFEDEEEVDEFSK